MLFFYLMVSSIPPLPPFKLVVTSCWFFSHKSICVAAYWDLGKEYTKDNIHLLKYLHCKTLCRLPIKTAHLTLRPNPIQTGKSCWLYM